VGKTAKLLQAESVKNTPIAIIPNMFFRFLILIQSSPLYSQR